MEWRQTEGGLPYLPCADSLWLGASAPLAARYDLLGVALDVASNSQVLAALADEVFGAPSAAPDPREGAAPVAMQLRLFLHDLRETHDSPLTSRAQGGYLFLWQGGSLGFADRPAGFAAAFLTPRALDAPEQVKVRFVECLGMFVVCRERPVTLHGAGVVHAGRCVLLTGADGAGKSTLAYACLRSGFQLLAEDIVFGADPAGWGGAPVLWGNPRFLHLLPDATRLFPELAEEEATPMMNGERKLRIDVDRIRPGAAVCSQTVWAVCSVSRAERPDARIVAGDTARIRAALTEFKGDPPLDRAAMDAGASRLAAGRIAHLEVGTDPMTAADVLRSWIEAL
jgi:hypothetical protein